MNFFKLQNPTITAESVEFDTSEVVSLKTIEGGVRVELTNGWVLDLEASAQQVQDLQAGVLEDSGS